MSAILNRVVRECFTDWVTFEKTSEWNERVSHDCYRKIFLSRRQGKCKSLKMRAPSGSLRGS